MAVRIKKLKKIKNNLKKDKVLLIEIIISILVLFLVVLLAVYSIITPRYWVTFNSNGGTSITSKLVKQNKVLSEPKPPIREGYEFVGWYYNDQIYDFDTEIISNIELVAHWKVEKQDIQIKDISLNAKSFSMLPNTDVTLHVSIEPKIDTELYWESTNTDVLVVDNNGKVSAKEEGKAIVRVTSMNNITDEVEIIVDKNAISLQKIYLSEREILLEKGTTKRLQLTFYPHNASNQNVVWMSDNTDVVSVSQTGEIIAKQAGEAIIVVTSLDDKKTTNCKVVVIEL